MFSPNISDLKLSKEELIKRNIVSSSVMNIYMNMDKGSHEFTFSRMLEVYILEKLLQSGEINLDEGKMLLQVLKDQTQTIKQKKCELVITRKLGVSSCLLVINSEAFHFEQGTKVVTVLPLMTCMEEIKAKLL
jgi:polyhydroxyalkanoate synthesis regulator phasin